MMSRPLRDTCIIQLLYNVIENSRASNQYGFFRIYRILKLIRDKKLKNTDDSHAQYAKKLINMKQKGRGPIILRNYMRKYGRIGASYTDDLGRRLEALE